MSRRHRPRTIPTRPEANTHTIAWRLHLYRMEVQAIGHAWEAATAAQQESEEAHAEALEAVETVTQRALDAGSRLQSERTRIIL